MENKDIETASSSKRVKLSGTSDETKPEALTSQPEILQQEISITEARIQKLKQNIQIVEQDIKVLKREIKAIAHLQKKAFSLWTETDKRKYGDEEPKALKQLSYEKMQLRVEKMQLRDETIRLLDIKTDLGKRLNRKVEQLALQERQNQSKKVENFISTLIQNYTDDYQIKFDVERDFSYATWNPFKATISRKKLFDDLYSDMIKSVTARKTDMKDTRCFIPFMVVGGGPGTGKSHVLERMHENLIRTGSSHSGKLNKNDKSLFDGYLQNCVFLYTTFNNYSYIVESESYPIETRILYRYILRDHNLLDFITFKDKLHSLIVEMQKVGLIFGFKFVVDAILHHSKKSMLLLCLDEIDKFPAKFKDLLSPATYLLDSRNCNFFMVCSALKSMETFETNSGRIVKFYDLPPLSMDITCFVQSLRTDGRKIRYHKQYVEELIEICHGHPRSLEFLVYVFKDEKYDYNDFRRIFGQLCHAISQKYKIYSDVYDILRSCILKQDRVSTSFKILRDLTFGDLINSGTFYNKIDESDIPFMTPLTFYRHLKQFSDTLYDNLMNTEVNSITSAASCGSSFEVFHIAWECLIRELLPVTTFCLADLYGRARNHLIYNPNGKFDTFFTMKLKKTMNIQFLNSSTIEIKAIINNGLSDDTVYLVGGTNAGFDGIIVSAVEGGKSKFVTLFATRFSLEQSSTVENIKTINRKHELCASFIQEYFPDCEWVLVCVGHRILPNRNFNSNLPPNLLYLDRNALSCLYGTTYGNRALCCYDRFVEEAESVESEKFLESTASIS